jgi:hypothetical protein
MIVAALRHAAAGLDGVAACALDAVEVVAAYVAGDVLAIEDDIALRKSVITPQSRGPPSLSA